METYLIEHSQLLGFNETDAALADVNQKYIACEMWKDPSRTDIYENLQAFREELHEYERLVRQYNATVHDVRHHMKKGDKSICDSLQLHPKGLTGIFTSPSSLSLVSNGGGYVEPLLQPLRHPDFVLILRSC